jgi:ABC-type antimicrobial peptide transport system permease subunit
MASSVATRDLPHVFVSLRQSFYPRINVLVRGRGDAATLARSIQSAVLAVDPGLPMPLVVTSGSLVRQSTEGQRLWARAAGALGLLALLLSAIGVYGVGAFAVTSRTREIGVRMAMGATRERVLRSVLGDAVRLAVPGLVVGGLLAVGTGAAMRSFLFGLSPVDPVSLGAAAGVLFLVVLVASLVPARRAARIDPMEALRSE